MNSLPFNRALHPDDYDHPELNVCHLALKDFEAYMRTKSMFARKDHKHREWEYANCLRQLRSIIGRSAGSKVLKILDTGSGASYFPLYLRVVAGHDVTVSDSMDYGDIEHLLREQCTKLNTTIPMRKEPVERMRGSQDNEFDISMCISVIEHVAADKFVDGIRELIRVTKPGGHIFITSDYFSDPHAHELSIFREIQHTAFTPMFADAFVQAFSLEMEPVGGVDFTYRGDFVNNYSFVNFCFRKL